MAEVVLNPDAKNSRVKKVSGEVALDGSNPTAVSVAGKITTVHSVQVSLKNASAPGVGTSLITYDISGATVNFYAWKVTAAGDATLIASTGTETIAYEITGI